MQGDDAGREISRHRGYRYRRGGAEGGRRRARPRLPLRPVRCCQDRYCGQQQLDRRIDLHDRALPDAMEEQRETAAARGGGPAGLPSGGAGWRRR